MKRWFKHLALAVSVVSLAGCLGGGDDEISTDNTSSGVTTITGFSESGTLKYAVYEAEGNTVATSTAVATVTASGANGTATFGDDFATTSDAWETATWSTASGKLEADGNVVFLCPNVGQGVVAVSDNLMSVTNGTELSGKSFQTFKCSDGVIGAFEQVSFDPSGDAFVQGETDAIPASEVQTAISGGDPEVKLNVYKTAGGEYFVVAAGKVGTPPDLILWVEQPN